MYITYEGNQRELYDTDGHTHPPGINSIELEASKNVPDFKPTWLLRVSDMKVVPGSSVNEHYWALSYSWNQSGEVVRTGEDEYERSDQGKHAIVSYETQKQRNENDWQGKQRAVREVDYATKSTRYCYFEDVLQRICNDFDVRYIFYDQKCINQNDIEEKKRDIKRMDSFYRNAFCSLVMVPELELNNTSSDKTMCANIDVLPDTQWSTRAWTLLEAYASNNMLFVGKNVHFWSSVISVSFDPSKTNTFIRNICQPAGMWKPSTAIWYARTRTSSKKHDRVFSLVNMFPELKEEISFNYMQPIYDLMIHFFGLLVRRDSTMLLFGEPIDPSIRGDNFTSHMEITELIPSWTGLNGLHIAEDPILGESVKGPVIDLTLNGNSLKLNTALIMITIQEASSKMAETTDFYIDPYQCHDEDLPAKYTKDGLPCNLLVATYDNPKNEISGHGPLTFVKTTEVSQNDHNSALEEFGMKATHFLPVKDKIANWISTTTSPTHVGAYLSLTEECSECLILSGVTFELLYNIIAMPVAKRIGEGYKLIGACFMDCNTSFNSTLEVKKDVVIK